MPKIMLIEDERTMVMLIGTLLKFEGFETITANNHASLAEILEFIQQEQPAMILLDIHLQQFSGFELLANLRNDPQLSPIKVLITSGSDYRERCQAAGADGFLLKPYMPEELIQRIRTLIPSPE